MIKWPVLSLSKLCSVLKLYESYQTKDAMHLAKKQSSKVMKGSTVPIPHNLFRKIAKMSVEYFDTVSDKIVTRDVSLKEVAENYETLTARTKTMSLILKEVPVNYTEEELRSMYPSKFTEHILDAFSGAVIGD